MDFLAAYGAIVSLVVSGLVTWFVWSLKRVVEQGVASLGDRVTRLEAGAAHMVNPAEVAALRESVAQLHGDIRALGVQIEALQTTTASVARAAERINDYLLRHER